jgi:lipoprotein NlpD
MVNKSYKYLVIIVAAALSACFSTTEAPVDSRPTDSAYKAAPVSGFSYEPEPVTKGFHQVVRGDTLYSISWRYGMDYREIARINAIAGNYVIYPGQRLRLVPDGNVVVTPLKEEAAVNIYPLGDPSAREPTNPNQLIIEDVTPQPEAKPAEPQAVRSEPVKNLPSPVLNPGVIAWRWPTSGEVIQSRSPVAQKGLDIAGREGQQISAAANGIVVYSGSGLLGYGKLIIIKHNETWLSAYAHNQMIQVNEGDTVSTGQAIGTMGKGNKGQPLLHFEIRKDGKPVDPLQYLPARS